MLHLSIRVRGKIKPLIYIMRLYLNMLKAQLQQIWSKLSDGLDGVDDREEQHESIYNSVFLVINAGGGGGIN